MPAANCKIGTGSEGGSPTGQERLGGSPDNHRSNKFPHDLQTLGVSYYRIANQRPLIPTYCSIDSETYIYMLTG